MAQDTAKQLESLSRLKNTEFHALWLEFFGKPLQVPSRKDFLVRCLAYRLQERAYGGLNVSTRKRLRKLAEEIEASPTSDLRDTPRIKPGTRLIREWRGEIHKVTVTDNGFAYCGKRYKSLSEIARLITGTHWSGPLFFGLKMSQVNGRERCNAR